MVLWLHAVITRNHDGRAHFIKLAKIHVEHFVKIVRFFYARSIFMLHKVGCGQVHHVWLPVCQQLNARGEHKFRQTGRIYLGYIHAQPGAGIVNSVLGNIGHV